MPKKTTKKSAAKSATRKPKKKSAAQPDAPVLTTCKQVQIVPRGDGTFREEWLHQ